MLLQIFITSYDPTYSNKAASEWSRRAGLGRETIAVEPAQAVFFGVFVSSVV